MLINDFLEQSAERCPHKVACICQAQRVTYHELNSMADSLANALHKEGLCALDRVVVHLDNSVECVVSIFAATKASGIFVVVNPHVAPPKLQSILKDCQARVLITDEQKLKSAAACLAACTHLRSVIVVSLGGKARKVTSSKGTPRDKQRILSYQSLLTGRPARPLPRSTIDIDLATIIYTSGSTGGPKGVMLTHLNMVHASASIISYLKNEADDIILNCLPLSFDYGLYQVLMAFRFGGSVVLERTFAYPYRIVQLIKKERVTGLPLVPAIAAFLTQMKGIPRSDIASVRYITSTAQYLAPKYINRLQKLFPQARIYSMYGLTECKRVSYLEPEELVRRPSSVGKAIPNTQVYLVDKQGNEIASPGLVGELVVRGAHIMSGYWNNPDDTGLVLKPGRHPGERVLHTQDYFRMDEDGFLYFVSRKDDIFKVGGEMVSPKEVEEVLLSMPGVLEAAVVPVPDDILGNSVRAALVLDRKKLHKGNIKQQLAAHCRRHLEPWKVPGQWAFRSSLPRTLTGKVDKKTLAD